MNPALIEAMAPTRHVGQVLASGEVVRALGDPSPEVLATGRPGYFVLLHRPRTGAQPRERWTIKWGTQPAFRDTRLAYADTFAGLYDQLRVHTGRASTWGDAVQMLHQFVLPLYDPKIPAEAAEQTLVALGAAPRLLPAALTAPASASPAAPSQP